LSLDPLGGHPLRDGKTGTGMIELSLSGRIAEDEHTKDRIASRFEDLAQLASEIGYRALCIRPSQMTVQTPDEEIRRMRQILDVVGLRASMVCLHTSIPANTPDAGQPLRDLSRDVAVAEMLGARLIRIAIKTEEDVRWAQRAADQARERGICLVHQTHTDSPFETIDQCLEMVARIGRPNFGLTVEPANLLLCGQGYGPEAIKRLGPHILNVYVQNLRRVEEGGDRIQTNRGVVHYQRLIVGEEGGIDFDRFFQGLRSIHYEGFVTIHQPYVEGMGARQLAQFVFDSITGFLEGSGRGNTLLDPGGGPREIAGA
jgi:sugar phosphate isomerase/epimerase